MSISCTLTVSPPGNLYAGIITTKLWALTLRLALSPSLRSLCLLTTLVGSFWPQCAFFIMQRDSWWANSIYNSLLILPFMSLFLSLPALAALSLKKSVHPVLSSLPALPPNVQPRAESDLTHSFQHIHQAELLHSAPHCRSARGA